MAIKVEAIHTVEKGPVRAVLLAYGSALALFKQRDQNDIVRQAMQAAGEMWIAVFLPLRFTDYVRSSPFNYSIGGRYARYKQKALSTGNTPNVYTGNSRAVALARAHAEARATKQRAVAIIRIPLPANAKGIVYGNTVRSRLNVYLRTIPPREIKAVAKRVETAMRNILQNIPVDTPATIGPIQVTRQPRATPARKRTPAPARRKG